MGIILMNKTIWSQEYSSYVSYTFLPEKERELIISNMVKINLLDCDIHLSVFGFYSLWHKDKKLKEISFIDYLKYRDHVKEIIEEVHYE